jgi:hypothetical protein
MQSNLIVSHRNLLPFIFLLYTRYCSIITIHFTKITFSFKVVLHMKFANGKEDPNNLVKLIREAKE